MPRTDERSNTAMVTLLGPNDRVSHQEVQQELGETRARLASRQELQEELEDMHTEELPKNFCGEIMRRGLVNPNMFYCGREVDPDSDGPLTAFVCGPDSGPQCPDCLNAQRFIQKTDTSTRLNIAGDKMTRGIIRREFFYCGLNGCGPSKGDQCASCAEAQERQNRETAKRQHELTVEPKQEHMGFVASTARCCCKCCIGTGKAEAVCCKCCLKSDLELCKCCANAEILLCKCCCYAELGFLEAYYQFLLGSAKLCWKKPMFACVLFTVMECLIYAATFHLPTYMKRHHGDAGFVWGFVLVLVIICCCMPCCFLCAPFAVATHMGMVVSQRLRSLESRVENLADGSLGALNQIHDRFQGVEHMITGTFGEIPKMMHELKDKLNPNKMIHEMEDTLNPNKVLDNIGEMFHHSSSSSEAARHNDGNPLTNMFNAVTFGAVSQTSPRSASPSTTTNPRNRTDSQTASVLGSETLDVERDPEQAC